MIQKSTSPWASPIVLLKKKSGKIRPCVDYRKVNELVKPCAFPLPRIWYCLDAVAGSSFFSTFDSTAGYHEIPVKQEDIPKDGVMYKIWTVHVYHNAIWFKWKRKYLPKIDGTYFEGPTMDHSYQIHGIMRGSR